MHLTVQVREKTGTGAANKLRAQGLIPGEVYGHGFKNLHVGVPAKEFTKLFKEAGETTVVLLEAGGETMPVLIYEASRDPLTDAVRHIDFFRVRMDEKITARVPIAFTGNSPAVKAGGVLVKAVHEIEVEALPGDMPHLFTADLSRITEIGGSVCVKDVLAGGSVPRAGIIKVAPNMVIATVIAARAEEETPSAAPPIEEVKVETEEKKALRQAQDGALRQAQGDAEREKTRIQEEPPTVSSP